MVTSYRQYTNHDIYFCTRYHTTRSSLCSQSNDGDHSESTITPTFTQVDPICNGDVLAALPTTSNNGVTGTWSPAIDNTATTTYTFSPDITQPDQACAVSQTMEITVKSTNYSNIHSSRPYL